MARRRQDKARARQKEIAAAASKILAHESSSRGSSEKRTRLDTNPVGVDIGTSKIVFARKKHGNVAFSSQLNAFISVQYSKFTESILNQNRINHYRLDESLVVYGDGAEVFANMLNTETGRPMRHGLLNPKESNAIEIIKGILDDIVAPAPKQGIRLCFSIPGAHKEAESDIIYHEAILRRHLSNKGYEAKSINEGLAVIFSELEKENFTGIGISAGGGMCNVCLAFLSVPIITFSIRKGGDYIDEAVASVTGEVSTRVRAIKEKELDLIEEPRNDIEDALHIYYDDLIVTLVKGLKESLAQTSKVPDFDKPIPIVLSGGTVKPEGFKHRFEVCLNKEDFPIDISEIRTASDPLYATAKGALIAAMFEG